MFIFISVRSQIFHRFIIWPNNIQFFIICSRQYRLQKSYWCLLDTLQNIFYVAYIVVIILKLVKAFLKVSYKINNKLCSESFSWKQWFVNYYYFQN